MKVSDLIRALQKFDQDAPVVIDGHWLGFNNDFEVDSADQFEHEKAVVLMLGSQYREY
jgi:hypothetical protein